MLVMNTSKKGLDNPSVRRAIAHCIDYAHIAKTAMSSYSVPAKSSVILPTGSEQKYFNDANVTKYGWKFDTKEAKRILEEDLKAKKGSDGIYKLPDGTRLGPWVVQTPTGWTDWQSALEIVVANAKSIGIDITTKFPQAPQVTQAVQNGDFDLACWSVAGVSPASPWQRFRDVLDSRGVPGTGKNAFYNYGRFKDPDCRRPAGQGRHREQRRRAQVGPRRSRHDLHEERPDDPVDVPPPGVLRVQPVHLDRVPRLREPLRAADVAGRGHLLVLQDQASRREVADRGLQRRAAPHMGFRKYIAGKAAWYLGALIVALILNFLLPRLIPGNPVDAIIAKASQNGGAEGNQLRAVQEHYVKEFGLDHSMISQFFTYIGNLFHGDLGTSFAQLSGEGVIADR